MLQLDAVVKDGKRHLTVRQGRRIPRQAWAVPKDFSAAAFFLVAGTIVPGAELRLPGVGINTSRSALLDVLRAMGASIAMSDERTYGGEPIADLLVRAAPLHGVTVPEDYIANLIDEIPVLCVAATQARGRTEIRNAGELRVKETDRIAAMVKNLRALGAEVEEFEDGLTITGGKPLHGAGVDTYHDHRIAMAMGVAGLVAGGETLVRDAEIASVSFPDFWEQLERIALQ
jgi:3-phosphoshikimate 1-carboxyvinyltransferase